MKLGDIKDLNKDDILAALGLASKPSTSDRLLGTLGIFSIGLVVGAGAALLLAPKSGRDMREDLGERLRNLRNDETDPGEAATDTESHGEART